MIRKVPDDEIAPSAPDGESDEAVALERASGASAHDDEGSTSDEPPAETGPVDEAGPVDDAAGADDGATDEPHAGPPVGADIPLVDRVEALLFATGQPLAARRLGQLLSVDVEDVKAALGELQTRWDDRPGAIDLVEIANGFRFMTRPQFADVVATLVKKKGPERLSPAALETLAVVAYRQPIGRADIEGVRGVQCGPLLRVLLDRDLIRVAGKSPEPGHPLLYGTTKRFLDHFGLRSLKALPDISDLLETS